MILYHAIKNGKLVEVSQENKLAWIEVENPTPDEMKELIDKYDLPRDYLLDVSDPYEVPRVEGVDDENPDFFILAYPVKISYTSYITKVMAIIIVDNIAISVRQDPSSIFDDFKTQALHKIEKEDNIENFILDIAWRISRSFIDSVKTLNTKIQEVEYNVKNTTKTDYIYTLLEIQKSLLLLKMANRENRSVINSIFELDYLYESEYRSDLMHDLQVENKQARIMIDNATEMVENLSDLYSNVVSNNLNQVMKVLTSITIIMTVPTIIGGLWGMNTAIPFANHPYAFWILIGLSVVISLAIAYFLKKRDFL